MIHVATRTESHTTCNHIAGRRRSAANPTGCSTHGLQKLAAGSIFGAPTPLVRPMRTTSCFSVELPSDAKKSATNSRRMSYRTPSSTCPSSDGHRWPCSGTENSGDGGAKIVGAELEQEVSTPKSWPTCSSALSTTMGAQPGVSCDGLTARTTQSAASTPGGLGCQEATASVHFVIQLTNCSSTSFPPLPFHLL
eukprot:SAG31_NODE_264_length_18835_cov_7.543553_13_plen_194_part_00